MNLDLNFKKFERHLVYRNKLFDGVQYVFRFDNNYGASVVKSNSSYGSQYDLWELAIISFNNKVWSITYSTDITNNVIGYLSNEEVVYCLEQIKNICY